MLKILTSQQRSDNVSLAMYYTWYYRPLFQIVDSYTPNEVYSEVAMERWIQNIVDQPDTSAPSSELRALLELARTGDELV